MKRLRLRTKFLLLFGITALIPLVLTLVLTYTNFQRNLREDAAKLENQLAITAAGKIKLFIISQVDVLNTIAIFYNQDFSTPEALSKQILKNIIYKSDAFEDLSVVNEDGEEIARENRVLVFDQENSRNLRETEAFETVREKGIYISSMYTQSGKPLFDLGHWIVDFQGNFSGAVIAQVDANVLTEVMANVSLIAGEGGRVFMVNQNGVVIAHSDLSYILGEKDLSSLPTVQKILEGSPDLEGAESYTNELGDEMLGSTYPIVLESSDIKLPSSFPTGWFVVVEQREDVVLAEARQIALFFLFITLGVLLIIVVVSLYFARGISLPIEALHKATVEFSKGNLKYRTDIKSNDEIGDLARNFDSMAETVQTDLEKLRRLIADQEGSAKMLVRRDLELTRANERLLELDEAKSNFISIVAHQLRTPLSGVKWTLNMVLTEGLGTLTMEQKSFLMKCYESNERMIVLINDMLGADRIDSGKFRYHLVPTQIFDLMDSVLFELASVIAKKELQVSFTHKDRSLPQVLIDTEKMRAVLQNLLENAIKYTSTKGQIVIDLQVVGKFMQISIKDNGIGIPEEDKKNVFSRFFRARNAVKMVTDGSGLGLFIAKGIIDKHGGKIWFESDIKTGTTFFFTIPIAG